MTDKIKFSGFPIVSSDSTLYIDTIYKWISVKDRLPDPTNQCCERVLTCDKYGYMQVSGFGHKNQEWFDADDVTHWMALPKPPKEI